VVLNSGSRAIRLLCVWGGEFVVGGFVQSFPPFRNQSPGAFDSLPKTLD